MPKSSTHASALRIGVLGCANIARQFVRERDLAAIERAAQASLDNAATLEALARSARLGHAVDVVGR